MTITSAVQDMVNEITFNVGQDGAYITLYNQALHTTAAKTVEMTCFHFRCVPKACYSESEITSYFKNHTCVSVNTNEWTPDFFSAVVTALKSQGYSECSCGYRRQK